LTLARIWACLLAMLRRAVWHWKRKYGHWRLPLLAMTGLAIGGLAGWWLTLPNWRRDDLLFRVGWQAQRLIELPAPEQRPYRYFATCNDARRAGYGSITRNDPSYRPELDEDADGVACEPYRGGNGSRVRPQM
jgi:hypothetical protein